MKRGRRTKIVATLGPSTRDFSMMDRLVAKGVDVFRINMSHSSHEELRSDVAAIRKLEEKYGPVAILADLQGPKLRISSLAEGQVRLVPGRRIVFDVNHAPGTEN